MLVVGLTDNELTPVPPGTAVPPQLTVYQSVVNPAPGLFTDTVEDEPLQIVAGDDVIPVGDAGSEFTVTTVVPAAPV